MEYSSLITNDTFLKLNCDECKSYLSYFPIYVSDTNKKNICGRCTGTLQESYGRNKIYETLAEFVKFPCRYKNEGCPENVEPIAIPDHERKCDHRIVQCPSRQFTGCEWKETLPECLNHCQDKHFDVMIQDYSFQLDLSQSYECLNLLKHSTFLFIVKQRFDSVDNLLEFSIRHVHYEVNTDEFPYEVSFKTINRTVVAKNSTSPFDTEKVARIQLHSLKLLEDKNEDIPFVTGTIKFNNCVVQIPVKPPVFEELLSPFICVKCKDYVLPPIFCQKDNSLCGEEPVICSGCKEVRFGETNPMDYTRNFGLEKVANLLNFPCKRKQNGCGFVSKPPEMKIHLESCVYGDHFCPLNGYYDCKWKGVGKDMMAHVLDVHSDVVLTNNSVISEDISCKLTESASSTSSGTAACAPTSSNTSIFGASSGTTLFSGIFKETPEMARGTDTNLFGAGGTSGGFCFSTSKPPASVFGTNATFGSEASFGTPNFKTSTTYNSFVPAPTFATSYKTKQTFKNLLHTNRNPTPLKPKDVFSKCYVIKFSDRLFRLNFRVTDIDFQWVAQTIGPFENSYMFELEIIDPNTKRGSLISRQPCVSLNEVFSKRGCYFYHDQIASLLSQQITFKIRIYK